jgi:NADPH:quinone reductase-like Zn-dependent oxidoreductase
MMGIVLRKLIPTLRPRNWSMPRPCHRYGIEGDIDYVYCLDADEVIDFRASRFEDGLDPVDVVIDLVGGDVQRRSLSVLKRGGILVSAVSKPDADEAKRRRVWLVHLGRCDHRGS